MYYDDLDYARKRLDGTLVNTNGGEPFLVDNITIDGSGTMVCYGTNLSSDTVETVNLSDIDLSPVKLGFVNIGGRMIYACRKPMRKDWKQGLSLNTLIVYGGDKRDLGLRGLTKTVMGVYPSFGDCVSYVRKTKNRSMAFSRDFGLSDKGGVTTLMYRKYDVGKLVGDLLVLNPQSFFLEQHLAEALG